VSLASGAGRAGPRPGAARVGSEVDAVALGERLRALRAERGLTLGQVAGARFSAAFLSQIERGLARPSTPNLQHIAEQLGVDADQILSTTPSETDREVAALRLTEARTALARDDPEAALEVLGALPPTLTDADRFDGGLLRGDALARTGREDEAIGVVGDLAREPRASSAEMRLRIAEIAGLAHYRRLRYHQAFEALRAAEAVLHDPGVDPGVKARFLTMRGACRVMIGDEQQAVADYEAALEAGGNLADLLELGRIYDGLNRAHQLLGNYVEALAYAQRSAQIFEVLQSGRHVGRVHHSLGDLHQRIGDLDEAERSFGQALTAFQAVADVASQAYTVSSLAEIALLRGDLTGAETRALEAAGLAEAAKNQVVAGEVAELRGVIADKRGDLDEAERHLLLAVEHFEATGVGQRLGDACHALALVLQRKNEDSRALMYSMRAFEAHHPASSGRTQQ
jgi:tetratricopeptide (TPR) repeat protein